MKEELDLEDTKNVMNLNPVEFSSLIDLIDRLLPFTDNKFHVKIDKLTQEYLKLKFNIYIK